MYVMAATAAVVLLIATMSFAYGSDEASTATTDTPVELEQARPRPHHGAVHGRHRDTPKMSYKEYNDLLRNFTFLQPLPFLAFRSCADSFDNCHRHLDQRERELRAAFAPAQGKCDLDFCECNPHLHVVEKHGVPECRHDVHSFEDANPSSTTTTETTTTDDVGDKEKKKKQKAKCDVDNYCQPNRDKCYARWLFNATELGPCHAFLRCVRTPDVVKITTDDCERHAECNHTLACSAVANPLGPYEFRHKPHHHHHTHHDTARPPSPATTHVPSTHHAEPTATHGRHTEHPTHTSNAIGPTGASTKHNPFVMNVSIGAACFVGVILIAVIVIVISRRMGGGRRTVVRRRGAMPLGDVEIAAPVVWYGVNTLLPPKDGQIPMCSIEGCNHPLNVKSCPRFILLPCRCEWCGCNGSPYATSADQPVQPVSIPDALVRSYGIQTNADAVLLANGTSTYGCQKCHAPIESLVDLHEMFIEASPGSPWASIDRSLDSMSRKAPLCCICFEKPVQVATLPCMHLATCSDCANRIAVAVPRRGSDQTVKVASTCVVCRSQINSMVVLEDDQVRDAIECHVLAASGPAAAGIVSPKDRSPVKKKSFDGGVSRSFDGGASRSVDVE